MLIKQYHKGAIIQQCDSEWDIAFKQKLNKVVINID